MSHSPGLVIGPHRPCPVTMVCLAAVRDLWLHEASPFAAAHDCQLFIASSLVHSHVVELFFPLATTHAADAPTPHAIKHGCWLLCLGAYNLMWLPMLLGPKTGDQTFRRSLLPTSLLRMPPPAHLA